jgi:hypothetical protein
MRGQTEKPDIVKLLEHFGADVSRVREYGRSEIHCPFHEDRSASGSVNPESGRFRCYAGCPGGDGYDLLVAYEEGVHDFGEASEWLRSHDLGVASVNVSSAPAKRQKPWRAPWAQDDDD